MSKIASIYLDALGKTAWRDLEEDFIATYTKALLCIQPPSMAYSAVDKAKQASCTRGSPIDEELLSQWASFFSEEELIIDSSKQDATLLAALTFLQLCELDNTEADVQWSEEGYAALAATYLQTASDTQVAHEMQTLGMLHRFHNSGIHMGRIFRDTPRLAVVKGMLCHAPRELMEELDLFTDEDEQQLPTDVRAFITSLREHLENMCRVPSNVRRPPTNQFFAYSGMEHMYSYLTPAACKELIRSI